MLTRQHHETLGRRYDCLVVTLPPDGGARSEESFSTRNCLVRFLRAQREPLQTQAV